MIATWVTQVSFFPQLVAISLENDSIMNRAIRQTGYFSLNLFPTNGKEIVTSFLKPGVTTPAAIAGRAWYGAENGSPFLRDASACLECRVVERLVTGDHELVVGEVVDAKTHAEGQVLTLRKTGWNYQR
jgi:flavin reductase (DIM6/NTAB) family NADH-FMN oxidoreductase RutF